MNSEPKPKDDVEAKEPWENESFLKGMSVERFWLWGDVLKTVAEAAAEDAGEYHYSLSLFSVFIFLLQVSLVTVPEAKSGRKLSPCSLLLLHPERPLRLCMSRS